MKKTDFSVFISYSSKDIKECEEIRDHLESEGIICWMAPRDILPGDNYASAIIDAIVAAKICLVFVSEHSNVSVQVQKEIDRAVNAKLKIIAYMLQKVELSKALNYYLCDSHWISSEGVKAKEAYSKLSEAVHHHLQHNNMPPPLPGKGNGIPIELRKNANWQIKFLLPLLFFSFLCAAIGGSLLFWPKWPGQLKIKIFGRSADMNVSPLPTQSLGRWTERFGKRMMQNRDLNTKWLTPAFGYLMNIQELEQKKIEELMELRQEIKARHGFYFEDPAWRKHFEETNWYQTEKDTSRIEEHNGQIMERMSFLDEDNTNLIEEVLLEKMNAAILQKSTFLTGIYLKIFPVINFDKAAAHLDSTERDLERLSYQVANIVANNMTVDKNVPSLWGPYDLALIDMKDPWNYFKTQQAPILIFITFAGEEGDAIVISHGENELSLKGAGELTQIINELMKDNPEMYPWKIKIAGNHEILKSNPEGISLLVNVNLPSQINDFSQMEMVSDLLETSLMELALTKYKEKFLFKSK